MYEETLRRKPVKGYKSFLGIIFLVYGALGLMLIVGYVQKTNHISYPQYIMIAGLVILGITVLRGLATEYVYAITQDKVQIIRKIGEKPKILIEFPFRDMIKYGKHAEVSGAEKGRKKIKAVIGKTSPEAFFIVLADAMVVLYPTEVFTQKLKEVYEKANC